MVSVIPPPLPPPLPPPQPPSPPPPPSSPNVLYLDRLVPCIYAGAELLALSVGIVGFFLGALLRDKLLLVLRLVWQKVTCAYPAAVFKRIPSHLLKFVPGIRGPRISQEPAPKELHRQDASPAVDPHGRQPAFISLEAAAAEVAKAKEEVADLKREKQTLEDEKDSLLQEEEGILKRVDEKLADVRVQELKLEDVEKRVKEERQALQNLQDQARAESRDVVAELEESRQSLAKSVIEKDKAMAEKDKAVAERDRATTQLDREHTEVRALQGELRVAEKENEELQGLMKEKEMESQTQHKAQPDTLFEDQSVGPATRLAPVSAEQQTYPSLHSAASTAAAPEAASMPAPKRPVEPTEEIPRLEANGQAGINASLHATSTQSSLSAEATQLEQKQLHEDELNRKDLKIAHLDEQLSQSKLTHKREVERLEREQRARESELEQRIRHQILEELGASHKCHGGGHGAMGGGRAELGAS